MIRVGILEIYNEEMKDLGMPTQAQRLHQGDFGSRLQIKEDPLLGVRVGPSTPPRVERHAAIRSGQAADGSLLTHWIGRWPDCMRRWLRAWVACGCCWTVACRAGRRRRPK